MKGSTISDAKKIGDRARSIRPIAAIAALALGTFISAPRSALADEGGVSFWVRVFSGILAATPEQPVGPLTKSFYHPAVPPAGLAAPARDITPGIFPPNLPGGLTASIDANADLGLVIPSYVFATPVLGGQASVSLIGIYGRSSVPSLAGTLTAVLATPFGTIPFTRSDSFSDSVWGFGDLIPLASLRWNNGVHNWMTYITGDVPVGAYDSTRLSNLGIGHGAIDVGGGYTYLNPQTGMNSLACSVLPTISAISRPSIR